MCIVVQMKLLNINKIDKFPNMSQDLSYHIRELGLDADYWMRCLIFGEPICEFSCFASLRIVWCTELLLGSSRHVNFIAYETNDNAF